MEGKGIPGAINSKLENPPENQYELFGFQYLSDSIDAGKIELEELDEALNMKTITLEQYAQLSRKLIKRHELVEDGLSGTANRRDEEKRKFSIDSTTGLEQDIAYHETVERMIAELNHEPPRRSPPLAALMIISLDMTGLKTLNDTYDHATGSRSLKAFADHLKSLVRADTDRVFRLGTRADEFAIVVPVYGEKMNFRKYFKKIQKAVNENLFIKVGENNDIDFQLTAAMGYAVAKAGDNITAKALISKADKEERKDHERRTRERDERLKRESGN